MRDERGWSNEGPTPRLGPQLPNIGQGSRQPQGRHLAQWIERVQADDLPALHGFVNGLGQDFDAIVAGLSLRYSSGAVEGRNNIKD